MASTYTFAVKTPASPTTGSKTQSHFQNQPVDGARVSIQTIGNGFQTTDATATPVVSPVTAATQTLIVPESAITVTLVSTSSFSVSEVSGSASKFTVPANVPITLGVANTNAIYLSGVTSVSFYFIII